MDVNQVLLAGEVADAPGIRRTKSEFPYLQFRLLVKEHSRRRQTANAAGSSMTVTCFNKHAKNICNSLYKGARVVVRGRIQANVRKDDSGEKPTTYVINAHTVEILERAAQPAQQRQDRPYVNEAKDDLPW